MGRPANLRAPMRRTERHTRHAVRWRLNGCNVGMAPLGRGLGRDGRHYGRVGAGEGTLMRHFLCVAAAQGALTRSVVTRSAVALLRVYPVSSQTH